MESGLVNMHVCVAKAACLLGEFNVCKKSLAFASSKLNSNNAIEPSSKESKVALIDVQEVSKNEKSNDIKKTIGGKRSWKGSGDKNENFEGDKRMASLLLYKEHTKVELESEIKLIDSYVSNVSKALNLLKNNQYDKKCLSVLLIIPYFLKVYSFDYFDSVKSINTENTDVVDVFDAKNIENNNESFVNIVANTIKNKFGLKNLIKNFLEHSKIIQLFDVEIKKILFSLFNEHDGVNKLKINKKNKKKIDKKSEIVDKAIDNNEKILNYFENKNCVEYEVLNFYLNFSNIIKEKFDINNKIKFSSFFEIPIQIKKAFEFFLLNNKIDDIFFQNFYQSLLLSNADNTNDQNSIKTKKTKKLIKMEICSGAGEWAVEQVKNNFFIIFYCLLRLKIIYNNNNNNNNNSIIKNEIIITINNNCINIALINNKK
jgi:hypothetical protein